MVSSCPFISKSSCPFTNPWGIVQSAPTTIGVTVTFTFHSFFSSLARSGCLSLFSLSFIFPLCYAWTAKSTIRQFLFFFFFLLSLGLTESKWSVCILKSQRTLCISFSRTDSGLCIYHLFVWSNLNFLHNSQWITFPTQSCLVLYSFCASLLHSLIMWLIVSSHHHITYNCYFVASYLFSL